MREILFRGKQLYNGRWIHGGLVERDGRAYIVGVSKKLRIDGVEVDPKTVCQFTGLTDKNGDRIWENDILKMFYENGETDIGTIRYTKECVRFQYYEDNLIGYGIDITCDMEVIGNIFDNPELMEGGVADENSSM